MVGATGHGGLDSSREARHQGEVTTSSPNHTYYAACHGAWRAALVVNITDKAALRVSGMGWSTRASLRLMAAWPAWLGRFYLDTTVAYDDAGEVVHTTVVRWLGIGLLRSVETIVLDADGRQFTMHGEQRQFPALWARATMSGSGSVDETGTRATYTMDWLGAPMKQTTVREPDTVTVTQEGAGYGGVQVLKRRR